MGIRDRIWYWTRLAIWPIIRDTDCIYCAFLRGVLFGVFFTMGGLWLTNMLQM